VPRKRAPGAGRPAGRRQDVMLNLRVPKALRDELDKHAAANRRSRSAEAIQRLRESIQDDELKPDHVRALMAAVGHLVDILEKPMPWGTGKPWSKDAATCEALRAALPKLLDFLGPPYAGEALPDALVTPARGVGCASAEEYGQRCADMLWSMLQITKAPPKGWGWPPPRGHSLGNYSSRQLSLWDILAHLNMEKA
jgi:Arc-like DNA binding domain